MTIESLSPDLQGSLDKASPLREIEIFRGYPQTTTGHAGPVLARHVSLAPCQRALQVLHPEAFARHLAERVVAPGDVLGFLFAGRVRIDFFVTGCLPCASAVRITGETTFEVDVNPVHGAEGNAHEP